MNIDLRADPLALSHLMEFDHVIEVRADGSVVSERADIYAPELYWANDTHELGSDFWELLDGYSGQYRYLGPIMHTSEYIGGQMARDILTTPGVYVALVCECLDDEEPAGWAVARLVES